MWFYLPQLIKKKARKVETSDSGMCSRQLGSKELNQWKWR